MSPLSYSSEKDQAALLLTALGKAVAPGARLLVVGACQFTSELQSAGFLVKVFLAASGSLQPTGENEGRTQFFASLDDDEKWDAVILFGSLSFLNPVDIFDRTPALLSHAGKVFLFDRFCLERGEEHSSTLPLLEYVDRLASRAGFSLQIVETLRESSAEREAELLLCCARQSEPRWLVGWVHPERSGEMLALFQEVFGHAMTPAHWHWKYGEGRGCGIGIWRADSGKLIAHYGGTSRPAFCFGHPVMAFQACDLMVSGSDRGSFSRQGPVFLAAASFLENQLGFGAPHLLGIGFPNERAYRLPERLGLYTGCLGRIQEVTWAARPLGWRNIFWRCQEVQVSDQPLMDQLNACWQDMLEDMGERVIGVRNADYLMQRYARHPDKTYRILLIQHRLHRAWRGVVVLRALDEERLELMDVISSVFNIPVLAEHVRSIAYLAGAKQVYAWLVDNILPCFGNYDHVHDLGVLVPGNRWTKGPLNDSVRGCWWLTGGDTDFR